MVYSYTYAFYSHSLYHNHTAIESLKCAQTLGQFFEPLSDGLINIVSCRDPEQIADILTKQLPRPKFVKHVAELGLSTV